MKLFKKIAERFGKRDQKAETEQAAVDFNSTLEALKADVAWLGMHRATRKQISDQTGVKAR